MGPKPAILSLSPTKSPINSNNNDDIGIDDGGPVLMIHLANYYNMYLIYFVLLIISTAFIYCLYKRNKNKNSNQNNVRYQAVNTIDPDFEDNDDDRRHRQHNQRRKKNVLN